MSREAYDKMRQFNMSDAAAFTALGLTKQPISIDYLLELLNFRGMLQRLDVQDGVEKWSGKLVTMRQAIEAIASQPGPQQELATVLLGAYRTWFSHVTNTRQRMWDTTIPQYSQSFMVFRSMFAGQQGMPTLTDFDSVTDLGKGRLEITQEQYDQYAAEDAAAEAERLAAEAAANARNDFMRDVWNPAWNTHLAPALDAETLTRSGLADALTAMAAQVRGE